MTVTIEMPERRVNGLGRGSDTLEVPMQNQHKTHCPHGHEYTPENTRLHKGRRECVTCIRERDRGRRDAAYWTAYRGKRKALDPDFGKHPPVPFELRQRGGAPEKRFWPRVNKDGPIPAHRPELGHCWLWTGAHAADGYGHFRLDGRVTRAHHFLVGKPREGMEWDHLCFQFDCVRPEHLEMVTHQVNVQRYYDRPH